VQRVSSALWFLGEHWGKSAGPTCTTSRFLALPVNQKNTTESPTADRGAPAG